MLENCMSFTVRSPQTGDDIEWRWPNHETPEWRISTHVSSVKWGDAGPLDLLNASALIRFFGLEELDPPLPLEVLAKKSPKALIGCRRSLETAKGLNRMVMVVSARCGHPISAEIAA